MVEHQKGISLSTVGLGRPGRPFTRASKCSPAVVAFDLERGLALAHERGLALAAGVDRRGWCECCSLTGALDRTILPAKALDRD